MARKRANHNLLPGVPMGALTLTEELQLNGGGRLLKRSTLGEFNLEVRLGRDSLWVLVRRPGKGGLALRTAYAPGGLTAKSVRTPGAVAAFATRSALGEHRVVLSKPPGEATLLRCVVTLTPDADLLIPFLPRDLYPFDEAGDVAAVNGEVLAAQRGLNSGVLFLEMARPAFGTAFYMQDLTALNPFFIATETKPDGCVGGQWPELGYQPPTAPEGPSPPTKPLKAGEPVVISDAYLSLSDVRPADEREAGLLFLDMLAGIYPHLQRPKPEFRNWPLKAAATLRDLKRSSDATERHFGERYVRPYTNAEYPDSMVQLAVLTPLQEYAAWLGAVEPLARQLHAGVPGFFDPELGIIRRYLRDVGDDKNADEVDSWYLYHPLANLGRLALQGDQQSRRLFLASMPFAMKAARHFDYCWPVQYNVKTLSVIKGARKPGDPGQSDVGGLYATVMLQAYDLTGEIDYCNEAARAIRAVRARQFELEYQSNITAWAVMACLRLYEITGDVYFRDESYVFLSGFFHNAALWESHIESAKHYSVFLGATCLHDGPYMALYECFESYWAFIDFLRLGGDDLPRSVRMLLAEYCRYTLHRAWFYYPTELPKEILSGEIRNGHIDRKLAFPLEDLYIGGDPPGQVGQEIYGCGAAFVFATRAFHNLEGAPFRLFCDYPITDLAVEGGEARFGVRGVSGFTCRLRLIALPGHRLPKIMIERREGGRIPGSTTPEGHWEAEIPADSRLVIRWQAAAHQAVRRSKRVLPRPATPKARPKENAQPA